MTSLGVRLDTRGGQTLHRREVIKRDAPPPSSAGPDSPRPEQRKIAFELVTIACIGAFTSFLYVWTKAPLYNPPGTIDPWLYTALWTNFHQIYHSFVTTYYASRIPWIAPGVAAHALFGARSGYFVVHVTFFVVGSVALYLACRRHLGWRPAAVALSFLIGSQMYFDSHRWDYEEGAVLTFLACTTYFSSPAGTNPRRRAASLAASGFFTAALVTTQLIDIVFVVGVPLLWWATLPQRLGPRRLRLDLREPAAFAAGAFVLLAACGAFARANGGHILFFQPQVHAALVTNAESSQKSAHTWLRQEPYFVAFALVGAVATISALLARRRMTPPVRRLLLATSLWIDIVLTVYCVLEFASTGYFFDYVWYVSALLVPSGLAIACLAAAFGLPSLPRPAAAVVICSSAAAAAASLVWFYRGDNILRPAHGFDSTAYLVTFASACVAIAVAAVAASTGWRSVGAVAIVALVFAVAWGTNGSHGTFIDGYSDPKTGGLYTMGQQEISFLRAHGFEQELPHFWYSDTAAPAGLARSLQSLYYYAYTYVDIGLPTIGATFRSRLSDFKPATLVLLCPTRPCSQAAPALRAHGYRPGLVAARRLSGGGVSYWIELYRITGPG